MPTVSCPSCGRPLEVDDAYRDWTVRCPHCATEFVPSAVAPPPRRRDRRDEYGYDDQDNYPGPEREDWEQRDAARLVYGPGTWLEASGWVGGLLLAGGAVYWFLFAAAKANNPNNGNGDWAVAILLGLFSAALVLPYTAVMVVGGRKMRALTGYGWALTASLVGIGSFVLPCSMCVCAFVPVGFGIWGVVALNNDVVRRAFDRNRYDTGRQRDA